VWTVVSRCVREDIIADCIAMHTRQGLSLLSLLCGL